MSLAVDAGTPDNGYAVTSPEDRSPGEFLDGLSQTAAISERLIISRSETEAGVLANPQRYLWWTAHSVATPQGIQSDLIRLCRDGRTSQVPPDFWDVTGDWRGYDHCLTPNQPGCWNGPAEGDHDDSAIVPPSSLHAAGVNVLFADGHVSFISDSIDDPVWEALGTLNGAEAIEGF